MCTPDLKSVPIFQLEENYYTSKEILELAEEDKNLRIQLLLTSGENSEESAVAKVILENMNIKRDLNKIKIKQHKYNIISVIEPTNITRSLLSSLKFEMELVNPIYVSWGIESTTLSKLEKDYESLFQLKQN